MIKIEATDRSTTSEKSEPHNFDTTSYIGSKYLVRLSVSFYCSELNGCLHRPPFFPQPIIHNDVHATFINNKVFFKNNI